MRRHRRLSARLPLVLLTLSLLSLVPASATAEERPADDATKVRQLALQFLDVGDAPIPALNASLAKLNAIRQSVGGRSFIEDLISAIDANERTFASSALFSVQDITGDGVKDAMVIHSRWTVSISQDGVGYPTFSMDGEVTFSARQGRTGRRLWEITETAQDGYVWLMQANVGAKGEPGFILVKDQGWSTPQPWVVLTAIRGGDASALWESRMDSVYMSSTMTTYNDPWIMGRGDFLEGRATDLLIALVTWVPVEYPTMFYDVGVAVIDGSDGKRVEHPDRERSLGWLPVPWPVGDQDADGLRDYVFGNNFGILTQDPGSKDPLTPPQVGGIMRARQGNSGREIWSLGGLDLGDSDDFAAAWSAGDQFGSRKPEVLIVVQEFEPEILDVPIPLPIPIWLGGRLLERTYVVEGAGDLRFEKPALLFYAPGRIDGDDEGDFLVLHYRFGRGGVRIRLGAVSSHGEDLWERRYHTPPPPGVCTEFCFLFGYLGIDAAGDLQPDGGRDLAFYVGLDNGEGRIFDHYVVDGLTGLKLHEGGEELLAPGVTFDRHGSDLLEIFRHKNGNEVKTRDGTDRSLLLAMEFPSDLPLRRNGLSVDLGDVTGDGCSDLLLTVRAADGTYALVIDGGKGKRIWSEVLKGRKREVALEVTAAQNHRC